MHHSSQQVPPEIAKRLHQAAQEIQITADRLGLGPTGKFPEGKLADIDEGEIRIAISLRKGKVVLDFGSPVTWIAFGPEQAEQIGQMLIERAAQV